MNKYIKTFLFVLLTVIVSLLSVCTKENKTYPLIDTEWEVNSITAPDHIFYLKSPTPYHVNFHNNNIFNMRLDVNSCGSTYRLENENSISLDPIYCTDICCDSSFTIILRDILKDVNSYKIEGEDLELFTTNRIINLSRINK